MSALKSRPQWEKLFPEGPSQDKKFVEALIKRLNENILKDPRTAKKAALILESWINSSKKK